MLTGVFSKGRAVAAAQDHLDLPLVRHGHQALIERILDLRANFSAYDATYVSLAERLNASLLTADEGLARATAAHTSVKLAVTRR
jgi:predicted nucleic acid-binding protein